MSDETSPPFSGFRNARPARKTPQHDLAAQVKTLGADSLLPPEPIKRKRRTRAEMEQVHVNSGDELMALKVCLKQLRGLSDQSRLTVLTLLKAVFE